MTGLLLLFAAAVWFAITLLIILIFTKIFLKPKWRVLVGVFLFALIFPLPLLDEIIGGWQFEQLCKENSEIIIDAAITSGKTVWFGGSQRTNIKLGTLQAIQAKRNYVDAQTQEPIYHYFRFEATGGWFIRALGISEGESPLLFPAVCQPKRKNIETIDTQLGLIHINRPTSN